MNIKKVLYLHFLSILEAAFEIIIPLCMAEMIDKGIDLGDMNSVWKYGIALLIFAVFQLITGVLSAHIAAKASVGFSANLRQDMYDNVQTFAFSNIDKFSTSSIVIADLTSVIIFKTLISDHDIAIVVHSVKGSSLYNHIHFCVY